MPNIATILALTCCLLVPSFADASGTQTFKLGLVTQVTHAWTRTAEQYKKLVEERTKGRIKIEIYPARQLGGDRPMFEQIQKGALEMGFISAAPIGGFTDALTGLQLPFLISNYEVMFKALTGKAAQGMLDSLSQQKVKGLAIYECGYRHIVNTKRPIHSPTDLKGLKYRVVESPLMNDIWSTFGTNSIATPYGEIYTGLQTGVLEAFDLGPSAFLEEKQYEVAKYYSMLPIYGFPTVNIMNLEKFNALSAEDQKILTTAAKEVVAFNFDAFQNDDARILPMLIKAGVKVNVLTNKEIDAFAKAVKPVWDKYSNSNNLTKQYVSEVTSLTKKFKDKPWYWSTNKNWVEQMQDLKNIK